MEMLCKLGADMKSSLFESIKSLKSIARYPMHMPGHKRRISPVPGLPADWDITEIEGADDLHWPEGLLKSAMERTAEVWGAGRTWFLVNGSTCGIHAAIRTTAGLGDKIIAARNCHKSVFHAVELCGIDAVWITPPVEEKFGIFASVPPELVSRALEVEKDIKCVVITSPTYEGCISDIAAIAGICHARGVPLIVDEAHGAHLGIYPEFPGGAVSLGADAVIQSAHKTLPSLTQTAFLHLSKNSLLDPEKIEYQLDIFETSSPSYPLMASLDGCTGIVKNRRELFIKWRGALDRFYKAAENWRVLELFTGEETVFLHDRSKLLISCRKADMTGLDLCGLIREKGYEPEMVYGDNVLAMTGLGDDMEEIAQFGEVLSGIDAVLTPVGEEEKSKPGHLSGGVRVCSIWEAMGRITRDVAIENAAGETAGEYVWAYPPGVPILAPGERIDRDIIDTLKFLEKNGSRIVHTGARHLTKHIKCVQW